jgi:hypothetical protein
VSKPIIGANSASTIDKGYDSEDNQILVRDALLEKAGRNDQNMMIFLYSDLFRRDFLGYVASAILLGCTSMPITNTLLKE